MQTQKLLKKASSLTAAASLALLLAACSSSDDNETTTGGGSDTASESSSETTAATGGSGTATYDAAKRFPHGSCMLWKPVSEIDHGLVVLIPASFGGHKPQILTSNGKVYATGREHVDARGHNKCNGIRYHYVFGKGKGSDYPAKVVLKVGGANYQIPNPGSRYE